MQIVIASTQRETTPLAPLVQRFFPGIAAPIIGITPALEIRDASNVAGSRYREILTYLANDEDYWLAFGDDANEDALSARGLENIVDRPGMVALRHRARFNTCHLILDHVLRDEEKAVFKQSNADVGPFSAAALLVQRGEDGDRAEHAAHDVVGRRADALRFVHGAGHGGEPRHHLHDLVERRAMLVGTGQKTLVTCDNQMRIFSTQFVRSQPLLFELPVAEIFQKHVGARQQPMHRPAVLGLREIKHDAALAAVEQREE